MSDTTGGFEVDGPSKSLLFGASRASENSCLREGKLLFALCVFFSLINHGSWLLRVVSKS